MVATVTPGDRHQLEAIVSNRSAPQKHVWRAKIILAPPRAAGWPKTWRSQARFMAEGGVGPCVRQDALTRQSAAAAPHCAAGGKQEVSRVFHTFGFS
jgi:hypothetical protein